MPFHSSFWTSNCTRTRSNCNTVRAFLCMFWVFSGTLEESNHLHNFLLQMWTSAPLIRVKMGPRVTIWSTATIAHAHQGSLETIVKKVLLSVWLFSKHRRTDLLEFKASPTGMIRNDNLRARIHVLWWCCSVFTSLTTLQELVTKSENPCIRASLQVRLLYKSS